MTDKEIQQYRVRTVVSVGLIAMLCVWCGVLAMRQEHEIFIHMGVGLLICMVVFSGIGELAILLMRIIRLLEKEDKSQ